MILLLAQNKEDYFILLSSKEKLKVHLICPDCNSCLFNPWSNYPRKSLPKNMIITIRRMRCSNCKVTHALVPAFLFGKIRHTNETIAPYVELFIEQETTISKISQHLSVPKAPEDISTLHRWFKRLSHQCKELLPLLKEEFKKRCPKNKFKSIIKNTDANHCQIKDVYNMAEKLIHLSKQYDHQGRLLSPLIFLNYFYWQKTGQPLLAVLKFCPI